MKIAWGIFFGIQAGILLARLLVACNLAEHGQDSICPDRIFSFRIVPLAPFDDGRRHEKVIARA